MTQKFCTIRASSCLLIAVLFSICARADVGIIVYESKGTDARRTSSGHVALISTRLCPAGISHLRACEPGEKPGAVLTRYANVATNYAPSVFVVPVQDHFTATSNPDLVPALTSGGTLKAMQIEYWKQHLRSYLPALSPEEYQSQRDELNRFEAGRFFRRVLTLEYLMVLLGPHKGPSTEPIALLDPATQELIPDGRWRESIGVQHMRSSLVVTAPASLEQEKRLIELVDKVAPEGFNAMTDNCSDFVSRGLVSVFGDSGLRTRPRALHVADAWITSPIAVATDFIGFARSRKIPLQVKLMPMLAGTRRPTAAITSISRGALVPDASQGKMAFSMKVYFNTLNPVLGLSAFSVDKLSGFVDLQDLTHERGTEELAKIANGMMLDRSSLADSRARLKREQLKVFGTPLCWQAKRAQFSRLEDQASELGLLSRPERALLLKPGQPYLLPRFYEQRAAVRGHEGVLMAGVRDCGFPECKSGLISSFLDVSRTEKEPLGPAAQLVSGRPEIRAMSESTDPHARIAAFRLITSVVNYDLSSAPVSRRTTESFDPDWQLFLEVADRNGIHATEAGGAPESLVACSCRESASGTQTDAFQQDRSIKQKLVREGRGLLFGPAR